jgi:hypothetical protein
MLLPRHESRPVPELTPVHEAYKLASSQEPVTGSVFEYLRAT